MMGPLRIATRGSALALAQAGAVRDALLAIEPGRAVELLVLKTSGDLRLDLPLAALGRSENGGGKGLFTKEIEAALLGGAAAFAVHSLKDLPVEPHPGLVVAAVPPRENPADVLVSRHPGGWQGLPCGAVVATGSPRRRAQLAALRPDLVITDIRGNVPTRIRKTAEENGIEATILARAGLARLGIIEPQNGPPWVIEPGDAGSGGAPLFVTEFAMEEMLPAPGQGALAVQCRASDAEARSLAERLNDKRSERAAALERLLLAALGGGCHMALGAHAAVGADGLARLSAFLHDAGRVARGAAECGPNELPEACAARLAAMLRAGEESGNV